MREVNFSYADKINVAREMRLARVRAAYPELFASEGPPEEHLVELTPFLIDKPQKYYKEAVYECALHYLTEYYDQNTSDLVNHFAYAADGVRRGALQTEHYSRVIGQDLSPDLSKEARVRGYWCPWYLNLIEDCLKDVCSPLVWAITSNRSNNRAQLGNLKILDRVNKLNTVPELRLISDHYNRVVRNACAHGGVTVLRDQPLLFEDDKGQQESWTDDEFLVHINGLLDTCNALALATMVFVFRNWSDLSGIFHYHVLPENERERLFLPIASTPVIEVQSVEVRHLAHGKQITIEATDRAMTRDELFYDILAVLLRVQRFYQDADLVHLGVKGPYHLMSWVHATIPALNNWATGVSPLEQFLQSPGTDFIIFPFRKLPLARQITLVRRGLAFGLPELARGFRQVSEVGRPAWQLLNLEDKSTGLAKRLMATLIVPEGLSRFDIEPMVVEATNHIRRKLYRTKEVQGFKQEYRKAMANRPAGYVWLYVFTKEKREVDMRVDRTASYYVCYTEWFDGELRSYNLKPVLALPDHIGGADISVDWGPLYPA